MMNNSSRTTGLFVFALLLLISATPILWFTDKSYISGTDIDYAVFNLERFYHRLSTWDIQFLGGTDRSNNVSSLPYVLLAAACELLLGHNASAEKLNFVVMNAGIVFSGYFFIRSIFPQKTKSAYLSSLIFVIFLDYNFYNQFLWVRLQLSVYSVILISLYCGIIIRGCNNKASYFSVFGISVLAGIICGSTGIQPPILMAVFIFQILLLLVGSRLNFYPSNIFKQLKVNVIGLFGLLLGGAYWIFPLLSFIFNNSYHTGVGRNLYEVDKLIEWVSISTDALNVFRLVGDQPWFDGWAGESYYNSFLPFINNGWVVLATCIIPIFAFSTLFIIKTNGRTKSIVIMFVIISFIFLVLSRGTNGPFSVLYKWLIDYIPFFWIQRAPWQKFTIITEFAYGVLLTCFTRYCLLVMRRKFKIPLIITFLIIASTIIAINYKFVAGDMFVNGKGADGYHEKFGFGFHIDYPDYLYKLRGDINNQSEDFNILLLPSSRVNVYQWGFGGATDITLNFVNKGFLFVQYGEGMVPPNTIDKKVSNLYAMFDSINDRETFNNFIVEAGSLNVKYIWYRNDFKKNFITVNEEPIKAYPLDMLKMLEHKSYGPNTLYKVPNIYIKPLLYSISKDNEISKIDYSKLNNSIYKVIPNNDMQKLVLNQSFNAKWNLTAIISNHDDSNQNKQTDFGLDDFLKIKIKCALGFISCIPVSHNILYRNYSNSWSDTIGDDLIPDFYILEFASQNVFYLGVLISSIAMLMVCLIWFLRNSRRWTDND